MPQVPQRDFARYSLKIAIAVAAALVLIAVAVAVALEMCPPDPDALARLQFESDIFKTIFGAFIVSMLGILIPAVITEARNRFEQRKESRAAYSRVTTGVNYLALRLATCDLAEAAKTVQGVHYDKHQAELFDDFGEWLGRRRPDMTPEKWHEIMYKRLGNVRALLEEEAESWDALQPFQRIALLRSVLPEPV